MKQYLLKNFEVDDEIKSAYYKIYEKHFVVLVGKGVDPQYIIDEESIVASTAEDATPVQRAKATLLNEIKDAVAYKFISASEIPDGCYPKNCKWSGNLADDVEIDTDLEIQKAKDVKIAEIKQACQDYLQKYITKDEDNAVKLDGVSHYFKLLKDDRFELREWLAKNKDANPKPTRAWSGTFIKDANGEYIKQERKEFPYLEIERILNHYVVRDENAYTIRDEKIAEVESLTAVEEIQAFDTNSIFN
jgi:hypothetical protein